MIIPCFLLVSEERNLAPIIFGMFVFIPTVISPNVHITTYYTVDMDFTVSISLLKLQGAYTALSHL